MGYIILLFILGIVANIASIISSIWAWKEKNYYYVLNNRVRIRTDIARFYQRSSDEATAFDHKGRKGKGGAPDDLTIAPELQSDYKENTGNALTLADKYLIAPTEMPR